MPRSDVRYDLPSDSPTFVVREDNIESGFIGTLQGLKSVVEPQFLHPVNKVSREKKRESFLLIR
jgi:hypothetical protein